MFFILLPGNNEKLNRIPAVRHEKGTISLPVTFLAFERENGKIYAVTNVIGGTGLITMVGKVPKWGRLV